MREYEIQIAGVPHTVQLNDADAKQYGDAAKLVEKKAAAPPSNKARQAANKR